MRKQLIWSIWTVLANKDLRRQGSAFAFMITSSSPKLSAMPIENEAHPQCSIPEAFLPSLSLTVNYIFGRKTDRQTETDKRTEA